MRCTYCSHNESKVVDSRESSDGVRRRRECSSCRRRYTTYERVQSNALRVVKRDQRREDFNPEKLRASLLTACAKRPLPTGSIDKLVSDVEADLQQSGRSEIASSAIGELGIDKIKGIDRVAYIRFASVYRDFDDIETFKEEIEALLEPHEEQDEANQLALIPEEVMPVKPRRHRSRRNGKSRGYN